MPERARNIYYDYFAERFEFYKRLPYAPVDADWVQLDRLLTKSGKLSERMTMEVWKRGVDNYLASEVGVHSLQALCSGKVFITFWNSPLDRFGKPRQQASQVGASEPVRFASWHPKFLAAAWKVAQRNKASLDAVDILFDEVVDMDEATAFARLKAIEADDNAS